MRIKKSLYIITFAVTIFGLFTACKKDSPFPTNPLPNGDVHLHLHSIIDTNININIDSMYFLTSGRKISISKAKLYISNIQLVNTEGDTVNVPGTFLYDNFDSEFNLGELPSAKYNTINFNVGLGPKSNSINPTSDSDILLFPSDMWFDVTPQPLGFTFLNFEGKIDTTTNANGNLVDMKSFSYKIGTNSNLQSVKLSDLDFSVLPKWKYSTPFIINLVVDYSKIFEGVLLNNKSNLQINTVSDNTNSIAKQIRNNIPLIFSYK